MPPFVNGQENAALQDLRRHEPTTLDFREIFNGSMIFMKRICVLDSCARGYQEAHAYEQKRRIYSCGQQRIEEQLVRLSLGHNREPRVYGLVVTCYDSLREAAFQDELLYIARNAGSYAEGWSCSSKTAKKQSMV